MPSGLPSTCSQSRRSPDYVLQWHHGCHQQPVTPRLKWRCHPCTKCLPRSNWIDGIHRENCHFASKPSSIEVFMKSHLIKVAQLRQGLMCKGFGRKNLRRKISPPRLKLGCSCCWWKSTPVWQELRTRDITDFTPTGFQVHECNDLRSLQWL